MFYYIPPPFRDIITIFNCVVFFLSTNEKSSHILTQKQKVVFDLNWNSKECEESFFLQKKIKNKTIELDNVYYHFIFSLMF